VRAGGPRQIAVFHCGFTYSGGGERIVIEEVLGLRRRGFKVECYAPTVDESRCYPDLIGEVRVRTFLPQLPRWFPYREAIQMAAASLLMPLYAWRLRGIDAIVACNQPSAWIAWWAARLIDVPYVVYLNQPNRLVYPRRIDRETGWVANADYRLLAGIVMRATKFVAWADRRSVQEADELLVNGDYIGDIIRRIYKREAVDCPAGCHVPATGKATSANQTKGGPSSRSCDLTATLPSGAISENSPSSGFSVVRMTRKGAPFHGASGEDNTAIPTASSQVVD